MMYMFGAVILIYFIGMGIWQMGIYIKKKWKDRK